MLDKNQQTDSDNDMIYDPGSQHVQLPMLRTHRGDISWFQYSNHANIIHHMEYAPTILNKSINPLANRDFFGN